MRQEAEQLCGALVGKLQPDGSTSLQLSEHFQPSQLEHLQVGTSKLEWNLSMILLTAQACIHL